MEAGERGKRGRDTTHPGTCPTHLQHVATVTGPSKKEHVEGHVLVCGSYIAVRSWHAQWDLYEATTEERKWMEDDRRATTNRRRGQGVNTKGEDSACKAHERVVTVAQLAAPADGEVPFGSAKDTPPLDPP